MQNLHIYMQDIYTRSLLRKKEFFLANSLYGFNKNKRSYMQEKRRVFFKRTLTAGAIVAVGTLGLNAKSKSLNTSNGVAYGKSSKKEILYKQTKEWELFYKRSY